MSLQCANCHGEKGEGGVAPTTRQRRSVSWKAPPLNTELLRFAEDPTARPPPTGPPTPSARSPTSSRTAGRARRCRRGVSRAAARRTTRASPTSSRSSSRSSSRPRRRRPRRRRRSRRRARRREHVCPEYMSCPAIARRRRPEEARRRPRRRSTPNARQRQARSRCPPRRRDAQLELRCKDLQTQIAPTIRRTVTDEQKKQALACGDYLGCEHRGRRHGAANDWAIEWQRRRANVSDGQLLFELSCARCHTQGWSIFDPTAPPTAINGVDVLGLSGGGGGQGGGIGFNLRDGSEIRRFGSDADGGFAKQQVASSRPGRCRSSPTASRNRHRQDARLRRTDAPPRPDRGDRRVRALLPRGDELSRVSRRRATPNRSRGTADLDHHDNGGEVRLVTLQLASTRSARCSRPTRAEGREHLEPDDHRGPHRDLRGRAVLRIGVPAARHEHRRPPRVPRRGRRAHRVPACCSRRCGGRRGAAASTRRTAVRRSGRSSTWWTTSGRLEDRGGAQHPTQGQRHPDRQAHEPQARDRRRDRRRAQSLTGEPPPERRSRRSGSARRPSTSSTPTTSSPTNRAAGPKNIFWHDHAVRRGASCAAAQGDRTCRRRSAIRCRARTTSS